MSASPKLAMAVNSPQRHLSYNRQYSDSPTPPLLTSTQPTSVYSLAASNARSQRHDLQSKVNTPTSSTDVDSRASAPLSNALRYLREDSNDEVSPVTQGSPEAQQLAAGPLRIARRAKAHVPSACVNCKRKHLACETRRPCNRCVQTGKEVRFPKVTTTRATNNILQATCVDVQHKKRGRPRLREEESSREVELGREYTNEEIYPNRNGIPLVSQPDCRRSKSYRELRSQPDGYYGDSRPQTSDLDYLAQQPLQVVPSLPSSPSSTYISETTPSALLTPEFLVAQHNHAFANALSLPHSVKGEFLKDLVISSERDKIQRLQSTLRAEMFDAPHFSHVRGHHDGPNGMPAIENLDLGHATVGFRPRSEYWTFRIPKGQTRGFPITISLANNGVHFIILTLVQSSSAIMLPSPHLNQAVQSQSLTSPSPTQGTRSPAQDRHAPSSHYHHSIYTQGNLPYPSQLSPRKPSGTDNRTVLMQPSPNISLDRYKQPVSSRTAVLPSSSSKEPLNPEPAQNTQGKHQHAHRENLRHLQLPPIRSSGTEIVESSRSSNEGRTEHLHGKQSPAKGSPQSGRKKKRQCVEIGDMLRSKKIEHLQDSC